MQQYCLSTKRLIVRVRTRYLTVVKNPEEWLDGEYVLHEQAEEGENVKTLVY